MGLQSLKQSGGCWVVGAGGAGEGTRSELEPGKGTYTTDCPSGWWAQRTSTPLLMLLFLSFSSHYCISTTLNLLWPVL